MMLKHDYSRYSTVHVFGSLVIKTDLQMEAQRKEMYRGILEAYGTTFRATPFPDGYEKLGMAHRCYDAAYATAKRYGLLYCEGMMVLTSDSGREYTLGHGWCCTRDGGLVDPVSHQYQGDSRVSYVGVPINLHLVELWHEMTGYHGMLDGFPDGRPTVLREMKPQAWLEVLNGSEQEA